MSHEEMNGWSSMAKVVAGSQSVVGASELA
jgi:hypothetical protein